ncbi:calponin homology domain-containing protein [Phlyctochytrium arcticum]|nr:calponin homology domain-containing protein [Phlyctochytrium arcticum]
MGESRTELISWLNDLLQVSYNKIEQCGTGAAHCQIMDSIYRDVAMSKVKFQAKHEYEYVANFKVLQSVFDKHKIDNAIPVERLIKCRFQDNLEFLQWMKKHWDQYYPGGTYDAVGRRGGKPGEYALKNGSTKANAISSSQAIKKSLSNSSVGPPASKAARTAGGTRGGPVSSSNARGSEVEAEYQKALQEMQQQITEFQVTVQQVEKEREFYFTKLRDIEIYVQEQLEAGGTGDLSSVLNHITGIMYKTEDGFEIPEGGVEGEEEEETF